MNTRFSDTHCNEPKILYGITPPKLDNQADKNQRINDRRIERIQQYKPDGLVLYDIQDEAARNPEERPFPYLETIPAYQYANEDMARLDIPKVVYIGTGKYSPEELDIILRDLRDTHVVFVGSPTPEETGKSSLKQAYSLYQKYSERLSMGGIAIAERHYQLGDEHLRLHQKVLDGCSFFISQCVYNAEMFKDMLSDYYYLCQQKEIEMKPVYMTLTPCGSLKTLEFIKWLGISLPRWLENDLKHEKDILDYSIRQSRNIFLDVQDFCQQKDIPLGCNIESVAVRKDEVIASFELMEDIRRLQLKG
mgnify:CR=1 FL=1